jgi:CubicO group peptidase (beta-lactamase class C family)
MSAGQPDNEPRTDPRVELDEFVDGLARLGGVVSAVEALVATPEQTLYRRTAGFRVGGEPLAPGCRFDAASLTKPWMATLAVVLHERSLLSLNSRLGELFTGKELDEAKARTRKGTLAELLRHGSGIRAWAPLGLRLGRRVSDRSAVAAFLLSEGFSGDEPPGPSPEPPAQPGSIYSDLGYLLWGLAAERATGQALGALLDEHVCEPLGVAPLGALAASPESAGPVVECRLDNGKEVELAAEQGLKLALQRSFHLGRPQDGNARALGFLTAHAGLFVTADEMLALAREWLSPGRVISREKRDRALAGEGSYALGWARQSDDGSSGPKLSPASFGHTGFTGSSTWIDPDRRRIAILMSHRLSTRIDFNPFRREFHRLAGNLNDRT